MDLQLELERWYRAVICTEQRHQAPVHVKCVGGTHPLSLSLSLSNSEMWTALKAKLPITVLSCSLYNEPHNFMQSADRVWAEEKSCQRYTWWPPKPVPHTVNLRTFFFFCMYAGQNALGTSEFCVHCHNSTCTPTLTAQAGVPAPLTLETSQSACSALKRSNCSKGECVSTTTCWPEICTDHIWDTTYSSPRPLYFCTSSVTLYALVTWSTHLPVLTYTCTLIYYYTCCTSKKL